MEKKLSRSKFYIEPEKFAESWQQNQKEQEEMIRVYDKVNRGKCLLEMLLLQTGSCYDGKGCE
jgi:hypothetical protein